MNKIFIAFLFIFTFAACNIFKTSNSKSTAENADLSPLKSGIYIMELIELKEGNKTVSAKGKQISLNLDLEKLTYSGKSGCNSYFGGLQNTNGNKYKFNVGGTTEMLCAQEVMQWEVRYLNTLVDHEFIISENEQTVLFIGNDSDLKFLVKEE